MRRLRFILSMLGFAIAAVPASATITYSYCTSGCSASGGSYTALQSATGATGLAFGSLTTFVAAGLSGSPVTYTDGTSGATFNGFNGSTPDSLNVSGTQLLQTVGGSLTSIQLVLPANTYAIGMMVSASVYSFPWFELVNSVGSVGPSYEQYQLNVPGGTSEFFGIVSDAPISSIFIWNASGSSGLLSIQSFELGEESPAPEAGTFFTMGGGLLGLYFCRRPRLRKLLRLRAPVGTSALPLTLS